MYVLDVKYCWHCKLFFEIWGNWTFFLFSWICCSHLTLLKDDGDTDDLTENLHRLKRKIFILLKTCYSDRCYIFFMRVFWSREGKLLASKPVQQFVCPGRACLWAEGNFHNKPFWFVSHNREFLLFSKRSAYVVEIFRFSRSGTKINNSLASEGHNYY